jgi:CybS, succinate dehydrogenase cytochrome B small subunit
MNLTLLICYLINILVVSISTVFLAVVPVVREMRNPFCCSPLSLYILRKEYRTSLLHCTYTSTMFGLARSTCYRIAQQERSMILLRINRSSSLQQQQHRRFSSSPYLEGDVGNAGIKVHHALQKGLAIMAPIYFLTPDRYTDGIISKTFGILLSTSISIHSWIGLNYVCRDYVPKISSKLLGPARIVTAGFSLIMFLGMVKISTVSPNGLKGLVLGLWTAPKPPKKDVVEF